MKYKCSFLSITCVLPFTSLMCSAQSYDLVREFNVALGTVNAMAQKGDTLFIGGDFSYVAQPRSYGTIVSLADGSPDRVADRPDAGVAAAVADGQGGWFVGGDFSTYNDAPHPALAHMGADGHLMDWTADVSTGTVGWALALGGGWLFAGGDEVVTAVDASTGAYIGWELAISGGVHAMALHDGILYVGGEFDMIGTQFRSNLAAIDISTGQVTPWSVSCNGPVSCLLPTPNALLVGGAFGTMAGSIRNGVGALNYSTALCTGWDPNADLGGRVDALALSGDTVYLGGEFTTMGGSARANLAAADFATGDVLSWDPGTNGAVHALCVSNGLVFAGGEFSMLGGDVHWYMGAVNAATGLVDPWYTPQPDGSVLALTPNGNGALFIGGSFSTAGSVQRINLAAIRKSTGEVLPWRYDVTNGPVRALVVQGNRLYIGGEFDYVSGITRQRLAAIDLATDQVDPWTPGPDNNVYVLAVHGNRLYAGGFFTSVDGQPRHRVASFELPSLALTGWDPLLGNFFDTHALAFHDNLAFVGMSSGLAIVDTASSLIMPFTPQIDYGAVTCLAEHNGTLYLGGAFTQVNGVARNHVAALDATNGQLRDWDPNAQSSGNEIKALAANDNSVFIGGVLYGIGGFFTGGILPVDPTTGAMQITEDVFSHADVSTLLLDGNVLYAGGSDPVVFDSPRPGLSAYGIPDISTAFADQPATEHGGEALIWPDPYVAGPLQVRWNAEARAPMRAELVDAGGRLRAQLRVGSVIMSGDARSGTLIGMDELKLSAGLYTVRLVFPDRVPVARLVVE